MEKQRNTRLYDLWECENNDSKKKSKSSHYIPSILPSVNLPDEGISYNPPLGSYLEFVGKVVKEEKRISAEEERIEKKIREDDRFVNFGGLKEEFKFTIEGPLSIGEYKIEKQEPIEYTECKVEEKSEEKSDEKVRSRLRRKKEKNIKKNLIVSKLIDSQKKNQKQQLESLKSLTKNVKAECAKRLNEVKLKKVQWAVKNLTTRKRLGRGKFEPHEEPILTPSQLPGSLRCLTSDGSSLIQERVKSLQQRNILPIGGANKSRTRKNRLKIKFVEKRTVKSVTVDSQIV
ncbi:hypothetical protein Mgra_00007037 [Meloidogyne graminicola]|uniref:Ribosome biogenesis protein NOP53 n=1 Tax=Meloidogyne graminicola TaxID=189291 RepID=A0A8S9ZK34_9BILA|nr:hypothetical protein Mgra_00007037 [Meloidogyne graminicola]